MHGLSPAEAITSLGEERFRQLEHETLSALGKMSGTVLATGGGAVTRRENYAPLHQNGIIVYLKRDPRFLAVKGRPLSQKTSPEELYQQRKAFYEAFADLTVECADTPEETALQIARTVSLDEGKEGIS